MILVPPVSLFDTFGQYPRAPLFVPSPVFPFCLRVDQQQKERHRIVVVEINDPHAATLAGSSTAPTDLAKAAGVRDDIPGVGIGGNEIQRKRSDRLPSKVSRPGG
jgi:hypothetical protein